MSEKLSLKQAYFTSRLHQNAPFRTLFFFKISQQTPRPAPDGRLVTLVCLDTVLVFVTIFLQKYRHLIAKFASAVLL